MKGMGLKLIHDTCPELTVSMVTIESSLKQHTTFLVSHSRLTYLLDQLKRTRALVVSHRIRGRCLVPRPGDAVPIRGPGSNRVSISFKVGSCPSFRGVAAPLLAEFNLDKEAKDNGLVCLLLGYMLSTCAMA